MADPLSPSKMAEMSPEATAQAVDALLKQQVVFQEHIRQLQQLVQHQAEQMEEFQKRQPGSVQTTRIGYGQVHFPSLARCGSRADRSPVRGVHGAGKETGRPQTTSETGGSRCRAPALVTVAALVSRVNETGRQGSRGQARTARAVAFARENAARPAVWKLPTHACFAHSCPTCSVQPPARCGESGPDSLLSPQGIAQPHGALGCIPSRLAV